MESTNQTKTPPSSSTSISILLAFILSLLVALSSFALISFFPDLFPPTLFKIITILGIPLFAYLLALGFGSANQYNSCKKVDIGSVAYGQIFVLLANLAVTFVLYLESLPLKKYIFGEAVATPGVVINENDYRIQFFSSIVKSVIPDMAPEQVKDGLVYFYWTFFPTLLASFTSMKLLSIC